MRDDRKKQSLWPCPYFKYKLQIRLGNYSSCKKRRISDLFPSLNAVWNCSKFSFLWIVNLLCSHVVYNQVSLGSLYKIPYVNDLVLNAHAYLHELSGCLYQSFHIIDSLSSSYFVSFCWSEEKGRGRHNKLSDRRAG